MNFGLNVANVLAVLGLIVVVAWGEADKRRLGHLSGLHKVCGWSFAALVALGIALGF